MSWLIVAWFLTFGVVPDYYKDIGQEKVRIYSIGEPTYFTELGLEATINGRFRVWGSVKTYQHYCGTGFTPFEGDFLAGAAVLLGPVEIGVRHQCDHPIKYDSRKRNEYSGNLTEAYVRLKGETRW